MIDPEELLFVVDRNNNPLEPQPRNFVHKNGLWHRTTGIWVINNKNQILCQKRSLLVDLKPGMWSAFFGGHLLAGNTYLDNAVEELSEELGIDVKRKNLFPYKIFKNDKSAHKEFQHNSVYKIKQLTDIHFEKEEVTEIKWFDIAEIKNILADPKATDWVKKPWDQEVLAWIDTIK